MRQMKYLPILLIVVASARAQILGPILTGRLASAPPASWSVLAANHAKAVGGSAATTPNLNCTGGNFIAVLDVHYNAAAGGDTVSYSTDGGSTNHSISSSTALYGGGAGVSNIGLYYISNVSLNSTTTISLTGNYPAIVAMCASGGATSGVLDDSKQNGSATPSGNTIDTGSITPSGSNYLVLTGLGTLSTSGTFAAAPTGFTMLDQVAGDGSNNDMAALAYKITSSAADAVWDYGTAGLAGVTSPAGNIASFVP